MIPPEPFALPPEAVFAEPWQAQAFALTVRLHEQGHFTWNEWADALSRHLDGEDATGERYYAAWLAALEALTMGKGLVDGVGLAARKAEWAEAYRRTPHGKPVTL